MRKLLKSCLLGFIISQASLSYANSMYIATFSANGENNLKSQKFILTFDVGKDTFSNNYGKVEVKSLDSHSNFTGHAYLELFDDEIQIEPEMDDPNNTVFIGSGNPGKFIGNDIQFDLFSMALSSGAKYTGSGQLYYGPLTLKRIS